MNKLMKTCGKIISKGAIAVAVLEANLTCPWIHYQPELPDSVKKFNKFYVSGIKKESDIYREVDAVNVRISSMCLDI